MSKVRIALGLVVAACAFGALVTPALAKKVKPAATLGKFIANFPNGAPISVGSPATANGIGSEEKIELAEGALNIGFEKCKKIKSTGRVGEEESETLAQVITFTGCKGMSNAGTAKFVEEEVRVPNFKIAFEYHSNGFLEVGASEESSTVHISHTAIFIKTAKGSPCTIEIPSQTVPVKAEKKPESEFEAVGYATEKNTEVKLKRFPAGFQEELNIAMEFTKLEAFVIPTAHCHVGAGFKPKDSIIEAEVEELKIKDGNLGFETKAEEEAEGS